MTTLEQHAHNIRRYALRMGEVQGQGYIGQALGMADILAVAYCHALEYKADDPDWEGRDRFLLSHGHYAIAHYAALIEAYASRFNETIPGPIDGTVALAEALHARGVPLYAITNFGAELWARFRPTLPVLARFRDIVVSGVEKIVKPDPAIYALAERRFGLPGPALLFVDDNAANIAAAQAAGWHGHHFSDPDVLKRDLVARGLL